MMPGADAEQAREVLRRVAGSADTVSWSVGIADWPPSDMLESALAVADEHLYRIKNAR